MLCEKHGSQALTTDRESILLSLENHRLFFGQARSENKQTFKSR